MLGLRASPSSPGCYGAYKPQRQLLGPRGAHDPHHPGRSQHAGTAEDAAHHRSGTPGEATSEPVSSSPRTGVLTPSQRARSRCREIALTMSQTTLAGLVGATRENVNRALSALTEAGDMRVVRGRFLISDPVGLSAKADRGWPPLHRRNLPPEEHGLSPAASDGPGRS